MVAGIFDAPGPNAVLSELGSELQSLCISTYEKAELIAVKRSIGS